MFVRKLCQHCETGKYTYELDRHSPECPYISCHNGKKCTMYRKLKEQHRQGLLSRIMKKSDKSSF